MGEKLLKKKFDIKYINEKVHSWEKKFHIEAYKYLANPCACNWPAWCQLSRTCS